MIDKFRATIIWNWGVKCFGIDHMRNHKVRAVRMLEEAAELAQACGVSHEQAKSVIDVVNQRPVGDPYMEVGGLQVTLSVLCTIMGFTPDEALDHEILRCLSKTPEDFRKRNQEKLDLGLTG